MNNDPAPSPAADRDLPSTSNPTSSSPDPVAEPFSARDNAPTPAQKRAQAQTKKKYEFVNGLMTNLDVLIYAELCVVYYMEYDARRHLVEGAVELMIMT
jgi:hypothetical protein